MLRPSEAGLLAPALAKAIIPCHLSPVVIQRMLVISGDPNSLPAIRKPAGLIKTHHASVGERLRAAPCSLLFIHKQQTHLLSRPDE
jgi:hypothetical protein